jgi:uncharacterized protein
MNNLPSIVHFEVPIDDLERAKKFYTELFGWKIEKAPGPIEFWMISITPDDENSNTTGEIGGHMMKRQDSQQRIGNYVGVASIEDYTSKIEKLGGKVLVPKMTIPGNGYLAVCMDTEGNTFSLWKADSSAK